MHRKNSQGQTGGGVLGNLSRRITGRKKTSPSPSPSPSSSPYNVGPYVPKNWAEPIVSAPKKPGVFSGLFRRSSQPQYVNKNLNTPFNNPVSNENVERVKKSFRESSIENYDEGTMRVFAYIYQKMMRQPYNPNKITLTPTELRDLKRRALTAYSIDGKFVPGKDMNELSLELFGIPLKEFNDEYIIFEDTLTPDRRRPFHPFGGLARIFPTLFKSDIEREYNITQATKQCALASIRNNITTLQDSSVCVIVTRSIERIPSSLEQFPGIMYLVVLPQYTPVQMNHFSENSTYTMGTKASHILHYINELDEISYIQDAFKYGGVQLIHPRLGFLLQTQKPEFYGQTLFLPTYTDPRDRIAVLTLQKYAAIRRYMWTKNPFFSAEVYMVDPITIADELRAPYIELSGEKFNIELPGEKFDSAAFFKEFRGNQKFVDPNGKVKYTTYSDPALDRILPRQGRTTVETILPWMTKDTYRSEAKIPIMPLPEQKYVEDVYAAGGVKPLNLENAEPYNNNSKEKANLAVLNQAGRNLAAIERPPVVVPQVRLLPKPARPSPSQLSGFASAVKFAKARNEALLRATAAGGGGGAANSVPNWKGGRRRASRRKTLRNTRNTRNRRNNKTYRH
jgi:hypothetical protein